VQSPVTNTECVSLTPAMLTGALQSNGIWSTLGIVYRPRDRLRDAPFVPDVLLVRQSPEIHHQLVTSPQIHRVLQQTTKRATHH